MITHIRAAQSKQAHTRAYAHPTTCLPRVVHVQVWVQMHAKQGASLWTWQCLSSIKSSTAMSSSFESRPLSTKRTM